MSDDPTGDQMLAIIEKYLRATEVDDEVAIRNTHGGILTFQLATVIGLNPEKGRLYTDRPGESGGTSWYIRTGKNTFHPTGQSRLFIPTDAVRAFLQNHPLGLLTYTTHNPE